MAKGIIELENIELNAPDESREDAIRRAGRLLVNGGYVDEEYIEGMVARDNSFSTYMGNMIALPHGENRYKENIRSTGVAVVTYPQGIDWQGQTVNLVIGIAANADDHLEILSHIVDKLEEPEDVTELIAKNDKQAIYDMLAL